MAKEFEPIPEKLVSFEEVMNFWETHDTADYDLRKAEDVDVDIKTMTLEIQVKGNNRL